MSKIVFRKTPDIPDDKLDFISSENGYLIPVCHEFAKLFDEDIYSVIVSKKITISVNNEIVDVSNWHVTKVSNNDKIIISPTIGDDDGGFLLAVIGIALLAVAPYLSTTALIGTASLQTFTYGLGLTFLLGGVSSILFSPDLPTAPTSPSSSQSQTYNWSGIQTIAKVDTPIPIVYGTHPVGGNIISLFTESDGIDSYLNILIALCEGEIEGICKENNHTLVCSTSDKDNNDYSSPAITLNDQPLRFYNNVEWWYRKGTGYQNIIPYFDGVRIQYDDGREVSMSYIEYITTKEVDQIDVNFYIPQLYNGEGTDLTKETIEYKLQYSTDGETYYTYTGSGLYTYTPSVSGDGAYYCTCNSYKYSEYKYSYPEPDFSIKIISTNYLDSANLLINKPFNKTVPYTINIEISDKDSNVIDTRAIVNYVRRTYDPNTGNSKWYHTDTTFYVGEYKVSINHNAIAGRVAILSSEVVDVEISPTITISGKTKTGIYNTIKIDCLEDGMPGRDVYYIRVIRADGGASSSLKVENALILKSITEIVNGEFIYPHTALLGMRIKSTDQLSGSPPNIITLVKGKKVEVPDLSGSEDFQDCFWSEDNNRWEYNGAERTWDNSTYTTEYSNNPILCVRDLVLSERYGLGEYYESSDLNTSEIITTIKECWKSYNPYSGKDYMKWWDSGTNSDWINWWLFNNQTVNVTTSYDSSDRTITVTGTGKYNANNKLLGFTFLDLTPITPLKIGQSYDLSITLSDVDYDTTMTIYGLLNSDSTGGTYLGKISHKHSGEHTVTISIPESYRVIRIVFSGSTGSPSFVINDISIIKTADSYEHFHTWNGVIDSGQAALTVLLEMCDSFRCWPVYYSSKINFISDRNTTSIQTLSVGDTKSFSQSFTPLSEIPYRLIGQLTDEARNYNLRSLVSKSDIPDLIKINENTIGLKGITSKAKAERELKFKHGKITKGIHNVTVRCSTNLIHGTAGDIISLQDDLPLWGHGGNIITYTATNLTVDTAYTFSLAATNTFVVKYKGVDNSQLTATIDTSSISTGDSLQTFPILNLPASPCDLSGFSLDTTNYASKQFRILSISRTKEDEVEFSGVEHVSSLYESEATLTIIQGGSPLIPPSPYIIPKAPTDIVVSPLPPSEGMGFALSAKPNASDNGVSEIVVQIDKTGDNEFETVGNLYSPHWATTYTDSSLKFNYTYQFKFFCKTNYKIGQSAIVSCIIPNDIIAIPPPKGLRIKGKSPNANEFDDKDVTIIWDSVGLSTALNYSVIGYRINVYKNSILNSNLLRTDFTSTEEYTYTYAMNIGDNETANGVLIFELTTLISNGWESSTSNSISVTNSSPSTPSGLTAIPWMKGMQFKWNKNTETDLDYYSYKTKGIAGSLPYSDLTGTFTTGERLIQWNASGAIVASALIDSVNASYVYLSGITGTFESGKIIGQKDYSLQLLTNYDYSSSLTGWAESVPGIEILEYVATYVDNNDLVHIVETSATFAGVRSDAINLDNGSFYEREAKIYIASSNEASDVRLLSYDLWEGELYAAHYFINSELNTWVTINNVLQSKVSGSQPGVINLQVKNSANAYADYGSLRKITNAALATGSVSMDSWSSWSNITNPEVSRFLNETELEDHPNETTISLQVKAVDVYANESSTASISGDTLGLNIKSTDIDNFAITSSKIFNKIPVITGDTWSDNTVLASEVQWNEHNLYYNGTLCVIASGHTSNKYIYWENLDTSYSTSDTHPASLASPIGDEDFIIAVNIDGTHDLAWNAIANQVIGSAYIQNLAVQNAHILDLHGEKIQADTITANQIKGTDFGTLTISSGKIIMNAASSLEVNATGGIIVNEGADITFNSELNNPGIIKFVSGPRTYKVFASYNATDGLNDGFCITPDEDGSGVVYVGYDVSATEYKRPRSIVLMSTNNFTARVLDTRFGRDLRSGMTCGANYLGADLELTTLVDYEASYANCKIRLAADPDPVNENSVITLTASVVIGAGHKVTNLGRSSKAYDEAYADNWNNIADFYYLDTLDDLAGLHQIKGSGIIDSKTGLELIDDNTLPDYLLHKKDKKVVYDPEGKPYIPLKHAISHLQGCVRQLDNKFENLVASLNKG